MLDANPSPGAEAIAALPNICRCGAYPRIRAAITRAAATAKPVPQPKQSFTGTSSAPAQKPT
jgi:isoquinoline 1-oxidoreductase alpha subunit